MTTPQVDRVLAALRAVGHEPKRSGSGWSCRCPAHDDASPSLSVSPGRDGRALVRCHAGCDTADVLGAIGLDFRDLVEDDRRQPGLDFRKPRAAKSPRAKKTPAKEIRTFATAAEAVADYVRWRGPRSATWTYHDAAGEPCGLVLRWDQPGGGKDFRPVARVDGRWWKNHMPKPRPLYGLPGLLASEPGAVVVVCEGEKAADAARSCGLLATTSVGGSKAADESDWSPLGDREVWVLPDHDEPGEAYAAEVARQAKRAGARSVRVLPLAERWDLNAKGDLADVLEIAKGDLEGVRLSLQQLAEEAGDGSHEPVPPARDRYEPFPVDVLPEPVRSYINESAAAIGCDPAFVALPLISALAAAIGSGRKIAPTPEWSEPLIVWTAVIAESGSMKSPAMRKALEPLSRLQKRAFAEHKARRDEWEAEHARWEVAHAAWKRSAAAAAKSGDEAADPPIEPKEPACRRMIASDVTTEAIVRILDASPGGLLVKRDELSAWVGSFDRYSGGKGGGDAGRWLEAWDDGEITVDRAGAGTTHIPRAALSITGGIQPGILARAVGREHRENGLLARFLIAKPPRRVPRLTDDAIGPATTEAMGRTFERLLALTPDDPGDDFEPAVVRFSSNARAAFECYYRENASLWSALSGDDAAAVAKLRGYAARLAGIVHLVRVANLDAPSGPDVADEASVEAGIRLARWFGREALRVYEALAGDEADRERDTLAEWIAGRGGAVTPRELSRGPRAYRAEGVAEKALADLVEAGFGRWEWDQPGDGGGRPGRRFVLG